MKSSFSIIPVLGFVFAATLCSGFAKTQKLDLPGARAEILKTEMIFLQKGAKFAKVQSLEHFKDIFYHSPRRLSV